MRSDAYLSWEYWWNWTLRAKTPLYLPQGPPWEKREQLAEQRRAYVLSNLAAYGG